VITQAYDPLTLTHEIVLQRIFSCKMGGAEQRDGQEEKLVARTALASLDVLHNFGNIWSHAQDKGNFFGDYVGIESIRNNA